MPSPTSERPRRTRDELLAHVVRRGDGLRLRRRALVGTGVVAAVALLASLPVLLHDRGTRRVVAAAPTTTMTAVAPEETTTTLPEAPSTSVVAAPTTTAHRPPTTTTSLRCHNSADPACGAFRWDRDPGPNAPLEVHITISPAQPKAGDAVTFSISVVDPDAAPIAAGDEPPECNPPSYGEDPMGRCIPGCAESMYGPWTPPARQRGERMVTYTHTYSQPGDYTAIFFFRSGGGGPCGQNPYSSEADAPIALHVSA